MRGTRHFMAVLIHVDVERLNMRGISKFEGTVMRRHIHQLAGLRGDWMVVTKSVYDRSEWGRWSVLPSPPVQPLAVRPLFRV